MNIAGKRPEQKERENGNDTGDRQTVPIKKDVIQQDVHDHRAEERKAEWDATSPNEQKQTTHDLKDRDGINVATADQRSDERARLTFHRWHGNEMQERVGPEDGEHEPKQDSHDNDGIFHSLLSPTTLDLPTKFLVQSAVGRGSWIGIVIVSILFGYGHYYKSPAGIVDSGVAGLILGTAYMLSGRNLWASILAHGLIDTFGAIALFLGWDS